jgi:hypothetical protein
VEDFSSKVGLPQPSETVESIDANHMQMARCRNKTDLQYRSILGVLKQATIRVGALGKDQIKVQEPHPATLVEAGRPAASDEIGKTTKRKHSLLQLVQLPLGF